MASRCMANVISTAQANASVQVNRLFFPQKDWGCVSASVVPWSWQSAKNYFSEVTVLWDPGMQVPWLLEPRNQEMSHVWTALSYML